jgi:hypothetical protein
MVVMIIEDKVLQLQLAVLIPAVFQSRFLDDPGIFNFETLLLEFVGKINAMYKRKLLKGSTYSFIFSAKTKDKYR